MFQLHLPIATYLSASIIIIMAISFVIYWHVIVWSVYEFKFWTKHFVLPHQLALTYLMYIQQQHQQQQKKAYKPNNTYG